MKKNEQNLFKQDISLKELLKGSSSGRGNDTRRKLRTSEIREEQTL